MSDEETTDPGAAADGAAPAEVVEEQVAPSVLDIIQQSTVKKPEKQEQLGNALQQFLSVILKDEKKKTPISKAAVDSVIAEIDQKLSTQLNEVMHNDDFQKLERSWRGFHYLVDNTEFEENNKVRFFNVTREELEADLLEEPVVTDTGYYKQIYTDGFGVFGGEPVSAVISDFKFGYSSGDLKLARKLSEVAAMSHAPIIAGADPSFFGDDTWTSMPNKADLAGRFEGDDYADWRSFRAEENSRYLGLVMPHFLTRLPFGEKTTPVKAFNYEESSDEHESYCWSNASFIFGSRMTSAFAKYRWCPNIIGEKAGGLVERMPLHTFKAGGDQVTKPPTEISIDHRQSHVLSELGFIPLEWERGTNRAVMRSANSVQAVKEFPDTPEGKTARFNCMLGTRLPYMFIVARLAHYLKILQYKNIGSNMERGDIEKELNDWVRQYVNAVDNPDKDSLGRKPLKDASVEVVEVPGVVGWYKVNLNVRPHWKLEGLDFTLSLVGKIDR
jgi:type VI secretion system protein ImpC